MARYICKRLLTLLPVLIGITIFAFLLGVLSPGDPVSARMAGMEIEVEGEMERMEELRHELGLDRPIPVQYLDWMGRVLHGDLGKSMIDKRDIAEQFAARLPVTVQLALISIVLTVFLGIGIGLLMGIYHNRWPDRILGIICTTTMSVPGFWLALLLMTVFSEKLHLLHTSGYEGLHSLIMPSIVLALAGIGPTARLTRANYIKQEGQQYVLVANSKGLRQSVITRVHILKNALLPVVTMTGTRLAGILGGSTVVESIFSLPGIGSYTLSAIQNRDYFVVQAYVLYTGALYVAANLAIDLIYFLLNPKMKLKEGHE